MTSEVVTNALVHTTGDVTFGMNVGPAWVRVEVGDASADHPTYAVARDEAERGRGLGIVDALASAWGITQDLLGKVVWFEVPVQP